MTEFEINNLIQDNFILVLDYSEELNDVVVAARIDQTDEAACEECYNEWNMDRPHVLREFQQSSRTKNIVATVPMTVGLNNIGTVQVPAKPQTFYFDGDY